MMEITIKINIRHICRRYPPSTSRTCFAFTHINIYFIHFLLIQTCSVTEIKTSNWVLRAQAT